MTTDSLKKRYLAKLSANLVGLAISVVTQAIIPRGLGPKAYGDFHFLSNFFNKVAGFLDMGTSIGFYTKLSQHQRDFGLVSFYLRFAGFLSLFVFVFVGGAQATGAYVTLWPDGSYPKLLDKLAKTQLLIIDDWLRNPLSETQTRDLLEIIDDRYNRRSTILATQIPVSDWQERRANLTLSDALMDRIVHNSYRLELKGESMRKRKSCLTQTSHKEV